jgi:hypothetical protein
MISREQIDRALKQASDENFLQEYYRDLVRPLLRMTRDRWPTCCGSTCEPCSIALTRVADRTLALLGTDAPIPE